MTAWKAGDIYAFLAGYADHARSGLADRRQILKLAGAAGAVGVTCMPVAAVAAETRATRGAYSSASASTRRDRRRRGRVRRHRIPPAPRRSALTWRRTAPGSWPGPAELSFNLISAVSAQGLMRFMTAEGKLNGEKFVEFLGRLLHNSQRPIFLIVDGHPAHRAAVVKRFVASSQGRLRLFFLSSYSPELDPDESVWRHLKTHNLGRARITGPDDLKRQALIVLRRLQNTPALVRAFSRRRPCAMHWHDHVRLLSNGLVS